MRPIPMDGFAASTPKATSRGSIARHCVTWNSQNLGPIHWVWRRDLKDTGQTDELKQSQWEWQWQWE